jgi:hypothetical protein
MLDFFKDENEIYRGLQVTYKQMLSITQNAYLKIHQAQENYFKNHPTLSTKYIEESRTLLEESLQKFEYSVMVDIQMHSIREVRGLRVNPNLQDLISVPAGSYGEVPFLDSLLFDHSLFLWRSFLDFYMKYLVFFCTSKKEIHMSVKRFDSALAREEENSVSSQVRDYFRQNVFNEKSKGKKSDWGNTLRSFRDKTAHMELLKLTMMSVKTRTGQTIMEPTTHGEPVSYFVQNTFENNAFEMLCELQPILYGVKWVPGPYRPD